METPPVTVSPALVTQPASQSVPMGLAAMFSASAAGSPVQYQWKKNGAAIAGATGSSYLTPPTEFADSGSRFTVAVSNAAGTVESSPALLTVTARAPRAGDLRFRQVAATTTAYGYGNAGTGMSSAVAGRILQWFSPALGTPFTVGSGGDCADPAIPNNIGCFWAYAEFPLAANIPGLTTAFAADSYASFQADLQAPSWLSSNQTTPVSPAAVINSLDLEPASALFALSWVQSGTQTGFELAVQTVAPVGLAAAAAQAGASGRVITAISNDGGQVTFLSYAWQADLSTVYEVQVQTASPANAPAEAAGLAAAGYIVTATGLADGSGDIYLVGTRVQGDTLPRPFLASASIGDLWSRGYAVVGVVFNWPQGAPAAAATYTFLGER
jgi:hypothetical protein